MSEAGQGALMRRVVGNTAYLQGAVLISGLGVAGAQFMAARMLTTPDGDTSAYDAYVTTVSLGCLLLAMCDLGVTQGVTRMVASLLGHDRPHRTVRVAFRGMAISAAAAGVAALVLYVGAGAFADLLRVPRAEPLIALSALWLVPPAVVRIQTAFFDGFQRMRYTLLASLVREPVKIAIFLMLVTTGFTLRTAIWGWVAWAAATLVMTSGVFLMFLRREGLRLSKAAPWEGEGLLAHSRYLYLPAVSIVVLPTGLRLMVGALSPVGGVGAFDLGHSLATYSMMALLPIAQALLPAASHAHSRKVPLADLARRGTRIVGFIAFGALVFHALAGGRVLALYGEAYRDMKAVLVVAGVATFFESFKVITGPLLQGSRRARASTWIEAVRLAVTFGAAVPLTLHFGPLGTAEALLLGCLLSMALQFAAVRHLLGFSCWREAVLPTLGGAVLVAGILLGHLGPALVLVGVLMVVRPPLRVSEMRLLWRAWRSREGRGGHNGKDVIE